MLQAIILHGPNAPQSVAGRPFPFVREMGRRSESLQVVLFMTGSLRKNVSHSLNLCLGTMILLIAVGPDALSFHADSLSVASSTARRDTSVQSLRWYSMFTNIPSDWTRFAERTFRSENLSGIVGMTVLTVGLIVADDETWTLSDRWYKGHTATAEVSDFFEYLGDGRPQFGLAAAFGAYGAIAGDIRALRTASQLVEVILACGTVVQVLKHVTGRESPFVSTVPGGRWDFFPNQIEYHKHVPRFDAFPSGHIATALATVTVIAENYPEWKWVRPVGYSICALIGISMANTGIHWYSDYPLGLFLGYTFGMIVSHPDGLEGERRAADSRVSIEPSSTMNGPAIGLVVRF